MTAFRGGLDGARDVLRQRFGHPSFRIHQVRVIGPGFYWKLPWQRVHRVSVATGTVSIAFDPEVPEANSGGSARLSYPIETPPGRNGVEPKLALNLGAVDFLKVVSGNGNPVMMFMTGKLKAKGDLGLAANIANLFDIPKA